MTFPLLSGLATATRCCRLLSVESGEWSAILLEFENLGSHAALSFYINTHRPQIIITEHVKWWAFAIIAIITQVSSKANWSKLALTSIFSSPHPGTSYNVSVAHGTCLALLNQKFSQGQLLFLDLAAIRHSIACWKITVITIGRYVLLSNLWNYRFNH